MLISSAGATDGSFVDAAYLDLLGRPADPGGRQHWSDLLAGGVPRQQIAAALLASAEGRARLVDDAYREALSRPADPGGRAYWADQLVRGTRVETLLAQLVGSTEFLGRAQQPG
jgi:hypothetical protein